MTIKAQDVHDVKIKGGALRFSFLKFDGIGGEVYKENIVIVNNLLTGGVDSGMLFYGYGIGSGSSGLHYTNLMIIYNTIFKPATGSVRSHLVLSLDNPYFSNIIIKNNILRIFFKDDWPLDETGGMMGYNLFNDNMYSAGYDMNEHSLLGDPDFNNIDL